MVTGCINIYTPQTEESNPTTSSLIMVAQNIVHFDGYGNHFNYSNNTNLVTRVTSDDEVYLSLSGTCTSSGMGIIFTNFSNPNLEKTDNLEDSEMEPEDPCELLQINEKKNSYSSDLEIILDEHEDSFYGDNMRISSRSGFPIAVYSTNFTARPADPETMAREYLTQHADLFGMHEDLSDLVHRVTIETPGGYHVRFFQVLDDYPVYKSGTVINFNRNNQVTFVANGYKPFAIIPNGTISLSASQAFEKAKEYLDVDGAMQFNKTETIVYNNHRCSLLAYKTNIVPAEHPLGDWEVMIDAYTGEIFRVEDLALHCSKT
jgi:predicted small secreted protein